MCNKISLFTLLLIILLLITACQHGPAPASTTTAPTENPFQIEDIQNGMTPEDISAVIGSDGQLLYSDVYVHKWKIRNWKTVYMWFYAPNQANTEELWEAGNDWISGGMSIADDAKNHPGDRKVTLEDSQKIRVGMSIEEVIDILGYGATDVGSGFAILQWPMTDGRFLLIHFIGEVTNIAIEEKAYRSHDSYVGDVSRIRVGMTYQEVCQTFTGDNVLACMHADIYQYSLKDGRSLLVWFCDDNGIMKSCNAEFG